MPAEALAFCDEGTRTGDELGPMLITPHGYQVEGFCKTMRSFERGEKSCLVVMPTGTGKTVLMMTIVRAVIEGGGRVLVVAHTGELVEQACNKAEYLGLTATVERASAHARPDFTSARSAARLFGDVPDPKLVVATAQTLQGDRLARWPPGHFDLVIDDEAHHCAAVTRRNVIDHFRPKWHLGFTATADRGDGQPICGKGQVFEHLAYEYFLHDAVRDGYLARPVVKVLDTEIDLGSLRVEGAKDLNEGEIEALLLPHVTEIVNELAPKLEGHRAVIFTPMVASAEAVASAFCSLGVSVASVSGVDKDRTKTLAGLRDGRYRHVVNAMLLTEGWDADFIDSVVVLRPTRSRALYSQMVGRCLRRFEGKPEGYIWGVNWKTHVHDLVHPVQIYDSLNLRINSETLAGAKRLVDSGEELDLSAALKRSQAERKEKKRLSLTVKAAPAKASVYTYDPLSLGKVKAPVDVATRPANDLPATEAQVRQLVKFGIDPASASGWSKKRASGFISSQFDRIHKGLCSYKQQQYLKKLGHPNPARLSFAEASAEIERLRRAV